MRVLQFYNENKIYLGILDGQNVLPLKFTGDMVDFISNQPETVDVGDPIPLDDIKFASPVTRPSKIICVGLNYLDHIKEGNAEVPDTPVLFSKFSTSLTGHHNFIKWNKNLTEKVDFEAELAVIIGRKCFDCPEQNIMEFIFGYTCANDVSARDLQFGDGQWVRGKSLDTFCPLGPWIVTKDEIPDPCRLKIKCTLNSEIMQDSNTNMMLFKLPELLSFISKNFTLLPGDVILTGTPHGVGTFREPSIFMQDGDRISVEIENIGKLVNTCKTNV
ncbi:fumarylacetoacetate hydrolase family protein [Thermodesulfobacteriota bacterium]